jgi:glycine cleavage system protein P-like pyridoxal-binding family
MHRNACWCPNRAHGTNPATAAALGYVVIPIPADAAAASISAR